MIVITGGTKGIGKALVRKFASEGHSIATCSRSLKDLNLLKEEITREFSVDMFVQSGDQGVKEDVKTFIEFIKRTGQPIDALINNAGLFVPGNLVEEDDDVFERQWQTNMAGVYYLTKGLLPQMIKAGKGHIFNVASIAGIQAYPGGGSYAISKHALHGYTHCLRQEVMEHGIRVTSVLPGATYTNSWSGVDIDEQRLMPPEDIAAIVYNAFTLTNRTVVEDIIVRPLLGDL